jgi:hypothetical protein
LKTTQQYTAAETEWMMKLHDVLLQAMAGTAGVGRVFGFGGPAESEAE